MIVKQMAMMEKGLNMTNPNHKIKLRIHMTRELVRMNCGYLNVVLCIHLL